MTYNEKTCAKYRKKWVKIWFDLNSFTGIIQSTNRQFLVFDINNEFEIKISYKSIKDIRRIKPKKQKKNG
jgi:hypothetical protein